MAVYPCPKGASIACTGDSAHKTNTLASTVHLPGFGQDPGHGLFSGSDALLAAIEEAYLYLFEHGERIDKLEKLAHDMSAKLEALEAANDEA